MSTDFSIKPAGVPAIMPVAQSSAEAVSSAVATELPASQSVPVTDPSGGVRNGSQTPYNYVSRQAVIDQAAASIVYQVIDGKTGAVVEQFPDEAVLRRRAYFHTLDLTKDQPARLLVTDRKA